MDSVAVRDVPGEGKFVYVFLLFKEGAIRDIEVAWLEQDELSIRGGEAPSLKNRER